MKKLKHLCKHNLNMIVLEYSLVASLIILVLAALLLTVGPHLETMLMQVDHVVK